MSSSVQASPKWLLRSNFPSCSESAEIWHVYSFCVKKCPWFFFQECRKLWTKLHQIQTPPPPSLHLCPSPNNVEFRSLRDKTLCMCLLRYWREIEGGRKVNFQECVWSLASPLVEKKHRDVLHKKSRHAKFQLIRSNLENRYLIGCLISLVD